MEAILRGAGALRARDIVHSGVQGFSSHSHNHTHTASETHQDSSVAAAAAEDKYMGILPVQKGQRVLATHVPRCWLSLH
ncbi:ankyrin repeat-containing protein [Pyrus ussuriensis x Pyrus communis]|uniref:Ankyrin repeat-containing protein n=1 Tax=Pyrus ussuriensis x Pyrus communis TaxID=2448454 RepID=A0A5N5HWD6_9ROSA|nr:ankyrin repeat-containing protein [Pyrus ussuriensis x Pyrus communis]